MISTKLFSAESATLSRKLSQIDLFSFFFIHFTLCFFCMFLTIFPRLFWNQDTLIEINTLWKTKRI